MGLLAGIISFRRRSTMTPRLTSNIGLIVCLLKPTIADTLEQGRSLPLLGTIIHAPVICLSFSRFSLNNICVSNMIPSHLKQLPSLACHSRYHQHHNNHHRHHRHRRRLRRYRHNNHHQHQNRHRGAIAIIIIIIIIPIPGGIGKLRHAVGLYCLA